jgi:hypothetical protein
MAKIIGSLVLILFVVAIINVYSAEGVELDCPRMYQMCTFFDDPYACLLYHKFCTPNKDLKSTVAKSGDPKGEILP